MYWFKFKHWALWRLKLELKHASITAQRNSKGGTEAKIFYPPKKLEKHFE